ncbi:PAS domain S-box protein [Cellulomonas hominis]|uniref:PAS domain S-box protein n=1 Tax=Cellulomonas hominis TaxID=156981 RepID=UPI001BA00807|nr:PAS domain S-box protein [Cellulomonas hominis]VTR76736.1 putative diguanylate cyclase YegE [Cellulomonas hominis]
MDAAGPQEGWRDAAEGARLLSGALAALTRDGGLPLDAAPRPPASAAEGAGRVPELPRRQPGGSAVTEDVAAVAARQAEQIRQLQSLIEAAPVGIGLVSLDGRTPLTNDTLRRLLGYSTEEFASMPFSEYTAPEDQAENERLFQAMVAGEFDRFAMEKRFIRRDGSILWVDLTVSLVRDDDGRPEYAIGMTQDITERKRLADELRAAELHYRLLVEHVPAVVYIAEPGPDGRFVYVSPRLEWMLGYTPEEWLADPTLWSRSIHPSDRTVRKHEELLREELAEGEMFPSTTYRLRHRDGYDVWVRDDAVLRTDRDGRPRLHGVLLDVTQEKALEERLAHMVDHDALTGLVNRAHFHRLVDAALTEGQLDEGRSVAVLYVDLDDFKAVNDGFGHAVGDRVLVAVADRLRALVPKGSAVARLGGDEFAILVTGPPDAGTAARAAASALGEVAVDVAGEKARVRASVGLAVADRFHTTELLLHDADQAMYEAKLGEAGHRGRRPAD